MASSLTLPSAFLLWGFSFMLAMIHQGAGSAAAQRVDQATMSELQHDLSVTEWDRGGTDYCLWRGVDCDDTSGAVVTLALPRRNLRGNLSLVTGLKSLKHLDLSANSFRGLIPSSIGELVSLEYLDLSMNKLDGPIPPSLGAIRGLRSLNLSNNLFTGEIPQELKGLDRLEELQISANGLTGSLPYWMGNLTELRVLSAYENQLTGVIPRMLGSVSNLQVLNLHSNMLQGPIPESVFASGKLEVLVLTLNRLNGTLPESVGSCRGLSNLRIGNNLLIGRIPVSIGNISSLTYFEADSNQLTGDISPWFARCSNLTLLNLANNRLTGTVPLELGQLKNLQEFIVSGNNLSGEIPLPLLWGKNLNKLDLSNNRFNGTLPDNICASSRLQFLMLNQNHITGRIPTKIGNCGRLLELQLGNNFLTGDIPHEIGRIRSLQIALNLSSNRLSGSLPPELGKLDKLVTLDVSNNLLTGNIPTELRGMLSLIDLNFSHNHFTGEVPIFAPFQKAPSSSFSGNKGLCGNPLTLSCVDLYGYDADGSHHKISLKTVLAVVGSGLTVLVMVIVVVALFMLRERQEMAKKAAIAAGDITASPPAIAAGNVFTENLKQAIDFEAVVKATMKDANKISSGTFSTAYKAVMPSGMVLMVKRLKSVDKTVVYHQSKMIKELERLASVGHKNLMRPIGYIIYDDIALLLHHLMPNGTLAQLLHDDSQAEYKPDWPKRLSIAVGVAEGLAFLHHVALIHLDISSGNIFLDAHFNALIGEIEISKLLDPSKGTASISAVAGSFGYIPPEYAYTMQVTAPGNVYSYGVLLLEILTSRWPVDEEFGEGIDLVKWVQSASIRGDTPEQIMDSKLSTVSFAWRTQMLDVLKIALQCTDPTPAKRPKMKKVVEMLLEVNKG